MNATDAPLRSPPPVLLSPTEALSRAASPTAPARGQVTDAGFEQRQGFCIGSLNLMIRYQDGSELTELPAIHRLPNAPRWFSGMANLHSRLVPVFDLARRFDIDKPERAKPLLLVLAHGVDAAGVVIDGLPQRLKFEAAKTLADEDCVSPSLRPFVRAVHLLDSQLWIDLDVPALLDSLEQSVAA